MTSLCLLVFTFAYLPLPLLPLPQLVSGHGALMIPGPRNAEDMILPRFAGGKSVRVLHPCIPDRAFNTGSAFGPNAYPPLARYVPLRSLAPSLTPSLAFIVRLLAPPTPRSLHSLRCVAPLPLLPPHRLYRSRTPRAPVRTASAAPTGLRPAATRGCASSARGRAAYGGLRAAPSAAMPVPPPWSTGRSQPRRSTARPRTRTRYADMRIRGYEDTSVLWVRVVVYEDMGIQVYGAKGGEMGGGGWWVVIHALFIRCHFLRSALSILTLSLSLPPSLPPSLSLSLCVSLSLSLSLSLCVSG